MNSNKKECLYAKDDFSDEERKFLWDGCQIECKYNKNV